MIPLQSASHGKLMRPVPAQPSGAIAIAKRLLAACLVGLSGLDVPRVGLPR